MSKILYAKPGEYLACDVCYSRIEEKDVAEMGKNHDCEEYFCATCVDFVGVEVRKI